MFVAGLSMTVLSSAHYESDFRTNSCRDQITQIFSPLTALWRSWFEEDARPRVIGDHALSGAGFTAVSAWIGGVPVHL